MSIYIHFNMGFNDSVLMCIVALLLCNIRLGSSNGQCYLPTSLDDVNKLQPLLLKFPPDFAYPKVNSSDIIVGMRSFLQLRCSGSSHLVIESQTLDKNLNTVELDCNLEADASTARYRMLERSEYAFMSIPGAPKLDRKPLYAKNFTDISCSSKQIPVARKKRIFDRWCPIRSCTTCIEVTFPGNNFPNIIDSIAIEVSKLRPYLATTRIPPAIGHRQVSNDSWVMAKGPIFKESIDIEIEEVYQRDYQRKALLEILNDHTLVDTYIPETGDSYLTAGKLFSEHDFFYEHQQGSAFFYENTVPVWKTVAVGNWELAGAFLRNIITKYNDTIRVFSGAYGSLRLPDHQGRLKTIFLARGPEGEPMMPVPEFLFKYAPSIFVRSEPSGDVVSDGVVLVTVNNPRLTEDEQVKEGYLTPSCSPKSFCQSITQFTNLTRGYTYCCSSKEFETVAKKIGAIFSWKNTVIM